MTSAEVAAAIGAIATTDEPRELAALAARIRRWHHQDAEAETVARAADRKLERLLREN